MREDFTVNGLRRGAIARDFQGVTVTLSTGFHRRTDQPVVAFLVLPTIRVWKVKEELEGCAILYAQEYSDLVSNKVRKMSSDAMCHMYILLRHRL